MLQLQKKAHATTKTKNSQQIQIFKNQFKKMENYLEVQWLGLRASTAGDMVLIPGQGTKILQAVQHAPPRQIN